MSLDTCTKKKLERLAADDRDAQKQAAKAREKFYEALVDARPNSTIRELAAIVGLSSGRVHELTTVRNRATAEKRAARGEDVAVS
jgi:hypothetical protein